MTEKNNLERLSEVPLRKQFTIQYLCSHPETCQQLREIGLNELTLIRTVGKSSSQIICEVHNTRIGIHHTIANDILVSSTEVQEH
jgi:Fe2+ transport system protein FeoA